MKLLTQNIHSARKLQENQAESQVFSEIPPRSKVHKLAESRFFDGIPLGNVLSRLSAKQRSRDRMGGVSGVLF